MTVFGPSVVVLAPEAVDDFEEIRRGRYDLRAVPIAHVVDAVETLMDADSGDYKRLPDAVDSGFIYVSDTYTGESVQRVWDGDVLQDTDDSSVDFVVAETPAPGS